MLTSLVTLRKLILFSSIMLNKQLSRGAFYEGSCFEQSQIYGFDAK